MLHWSEFDPYEVERNIFRRLAYVGRYGHFGLRDLVALSSRDLWLLAQALAEIVRDENRPSP